ncbi:MAG: hypothetical protein AAGL96_13375 [Pseudomonadota bacterium]
MKKNVALLAVLAVAAAAAFWALSPAAPPAQMRLQANLAGSGIDVTDKVTWFVERDGSWLGPGIDTVSPAVPGAYEARFEVLGAEPVVATLSLGDDEGGTLAATLDATLIAVALPDNMRDAPVSFRYASDRILGSNGVQIDATGTARALVSVDLRTLELEVDGQTLPIAANFASGGVERFTLENGAVVATP